jgi:hypothetical protein
MCALFAGAGTAALNPYAASREQAMRVPWSIFSKRSWPLTDNARFPLAMRTIILAYVISFLGLVMAIGGVWGLFRVVPRKNRPVPWRYYVMAFAMISGGITMLGIAQALRLLVGIILEGL